MPYNCHSDDWPEPKYKGMQGTSKLGGWQSYRHPGQADGVLAESMPSQSDGICNIF